MVDRTYLPKRGCIGASRYTLFSTNGFMHRAKVPAAAASPVVSRKLV